MHSIFRSLIQNKTHWVLKTETGDEDGRRDINTHRISTEQELGPFTGGASGSNEVAEIQVDIINAPIPRGDTEVDRSSYELNRFTQNHTNGTPPTHVPYPSVRNAINDYNTPGILSQAFPCLFPYGKGDITTRDRRKFVTNTIGAQHYMKYCVNIKNARTHLEDANTNQQNRLPHVYNERDNPSPWIYPFVQHERFVHWIQNLVERHRASGQRSFWIGKNDRFANLSNENLLEIINERGVRYNELLGSMQSFNANINGCPQYLFQKRKLLEAMIDQLGMPTIWFTFSMADNHWADLHELLQRDNTGRPTQPPDFRQSVQAEASWKRKVVRENPHIVDAYFQTRVRNLFRTMFGKSGLSTEWQWYRVEYQNRGAPHIHGCCKLNHDPNLTKLAKQVIDGRVSEQMLIRRGLLQVNAVDAYNKSLDSWLSREDIELPTISPADEETLRSKITEGIEAHKQIVSFHDFLLSANHVQPPTDAKQPERCPTTFYKPQTTTTRHPSAIRVKPILDNPGQLQSLYSNSLDVQYRHVHQRYCDRNFDRRELAKNAEENGTLGSRQQKAQDIPVDCRFSFPKPLRNKTHVVVEELHYDEGNVVHRASIAQKRNDVWLNSTIRPISEVWGANIDVQLILDPGMVIGYMTKYVTKSELSKSSTINRLMKTIFHETMEQGKSTQTFLRRMMSKMLGERTMSKQEKAHLVMSLPIVSASHRLVNVDLQNMNCTLQFQRHSTSPDQQQVIQYSETASTHRVAQTMPHDNAQVTTRQQAQEINNPEIGIGIKKLTMIDAYAKRHDIQIWSNERLYRNLTDPDALPLLNFCLQYYVNRDNTIAARAGNNVVINFYPVYSCDPQGPSYIDYCKISLLKYKPWKDDHTQVWGGTDATSEDVKRVWDDFVARLGEDAPDRLLREIDMAQRSLRQTTSRTHHSGQTNEEHDYTNNPQGSYVSDDAVPNAEDDLLILDDSCISAVMTDRLNDDIDTADIDWNQEHNFVESSQLSVSDANALKTRLAVAKNETTTSHRRVVSKDTLNERQLLAHDMIVTACLLGPGESSTDGGEQIGRLQILLGAGGCGKSYVIDAVINTLTLQHGWASDRYGIYATTGKAATSINGYTIQNYSQGLCYFSLLKLELS